MEKGEEARLRVRANTCATIILFGDNSFIVDSGKLN